MKNIILRRKSHESFLSSVKDALIKKELQRRAHAFNVRRGMPISVFGNDWIGIHINVNGIYEREHLSDLKELLKKIGIDTKSSTAIDIGANIGNHAIEFSKYFSNVICFEPNPRTFDILAANAKQVTNIQVNNWGCSSSNQKIELQEDFDNIGASSAVMKISSARPVDIFVKPLDELIESFRAVSLIKIDVEGMESEALKGAELTISKFHPVICLEQHESEFSDSFKETESLDWLRSKGYKIFSLERKKQRHYVLRRLNNLKQLFFGITDDRIIVEYERLPKATYSMVYAVHSSMI